MRGKKQLERRSDSIRSKRALTPPVLLPEIVLFLQNLAGVHDACRIEGRLDVAHQVERDILLEESQFFPLELTNTVFSRNRTRIARDDRVNTMVQFVPARKESFLVGAYRLRNIVMQIAIADM